MNNLQTHSQTHQLTPIPNPSLDDLALQYQAAKRMLASAQEAVDLAASDLINAVGLETEGSFSVRCDHYKITTTQPVNRTVSKAAVLAILREIPQDIGEALFEFKPSLNVKLFKECEHLRPEVYHMACKAVTSKPGKAQVKVEALS